MEKEDKDGLHGHASFRCLVYVCPESFFCSLFLEVEPAHWLGAYRTNALYSGHIFVRFNDLEDVFT